MDRQQLLPVSLLVSLLLLPLSCGESEVDTSAPAMSQPNLSSPCLDRGLSALPLLCKASQGHQEGLVHKFQKLFLQPLLADQAEDCGAGDYTLLLNFSTPLISLPPYQVSLSSIWPFLCLLLHSFGCPQSSLFFILWQFIHTPGSYLELDYGFLINVSGLCFNSLFLTTGKQIPVLGRAGTLHSTRNSSWSWQNPSPGALREQVYPRLPDLPQPFLLSVLGKSPWTLLDTSLPSSCVSSTKDPFTQNTHPAFIPHAQTSAQSSPCYLLAWGAVTFNSQAQVPPST